MKRKLLKLMEKNKYTLAASPPLQTMDFIKAAINGGAHAVKVHVNVAHLASGNNFGSLSQEKEFLQEVIELAGDDVLVGLVPGADQAFITEEERTEIEEMGISFFSVYDKHCPPFMMDSPILTRMIAIHYDYDEMLLKGISSDPKIDVVEASIMPATEYGAEIVYKDLIRYRHIVESLKQPVLIAAQKCVKPSEVRALYELGSRAIMIGTKVMGEQTPEACYAATAKFREAIEKL